MCGIAGFLGSPEPHSGAFHHSVTRMANALRHRGPDADGVWTDAGNGVGLGHRRLSIVELSPEGSQPMVSADERHVLVFNGEIYNHDIIRKELQDGGTTFRGHSDTRVLVEAIARWGVEGALSRCTGMFAFAVWDRYERVLALARDRMGEKPLYYGWLGDTFLFGSELKALRAHPVWKERGGGVDRNALAAYLRHNYIPAPLSIYNDIRKLEPGALLSVRADRPGVVEQKEYWSLAAVALEGVANPFRGDAGEAADAFGRLLEASIARQMVADVPLGAFLSGGVDSSAVAALMVKAQAQGSRSVRTFTIGFHEKSVNESEFARTVASHLGTDHTEMFVSGADALATVPRLPEIYDEPFGDSSAIPTVLLSALTRRHVTVALSGDGADELLAGYTRYEQGERIRRVHAALPAAARQGLGGLATAVAATLSRIPAGFEERLPARLRSLNVPTRLRTLRDLLACKTDEALYSHLISLWRHPNEIALGVERAAVPAGGTTGREHAGEFLRSMQLHDQLIYLPDDIMVKVDRASMAASLETRAPLLDHALVEFAWTLPPALLRTEAGLSKGPLRNVLYRHVPPRLIERPKKGFGVPLASWLRGPLRDWAEALLSENRLRHEGFLDPVRVRAGWKKFLAGAWHGENYLWNLLMFQAWLERENGG